MLNTVLNDKISDEFIKINDFEVNGFEIFENKLAKIINEDESTVSSIAKNVIRAGGKRIRPKLVLCSGQTISTLDIEMIYCAIATELIHSASLIHDDIIDNSDKRRGQTTINSKYGNHIAVLCGDYLFAKAFEVLSNYTTQRTIAIFTNAIKQMCDGEIIQSRDKFKWNITEEEYFLRIYKKTGALIEASCLGGVICANGSTEQMDALKNFGVNIGNAFQIVDDILDFIGDTKSIGKPVGSDLIEGNITIPLIMLLSKYKNKILDEITKKPYISKEEAKYIIEEIKKSGIVDECVKIAKNNVEKAKNSLSVKFIYNRDYKDILLWEAEKIIRSV